MADTDVLGKNEVVIKWEEISKDKRNGFITNYTIFYKPEGGKELSKYTVNIKDYNRALTICCLIIIIIFVTISILCYYVFILYILYFVIMYLLHKYV